MNKLLFGDLRRVLRMGLDRALSRKDLPLVRLGDPCPWYIVRDALGPGAQVLSGGAGNDISFELTLAAEHGCRVAVFDPSPTGKATFARYSPSPMHISFHEAGLAAASTTLAFSAPEDPKEGSYKMPTQATNLGSDSFPCLAPQDAMGKAGMTGIDLLKIDIEGFEYEFLSAMLAVGIRPAQIAVEFHHFMAGISFWRTFSTIMRLWRADYRLVHKSRYDYLFIRKDMIESLRTRYREGRAG